MPTTTGKDYYISQKPKYVEVFSRRTNHIRTLLVRKFDNDKIEKILKQMKEEFVNLIPKIPYIGGAKNIFTPFLIQDISCLAIIRILEKEGFSYREIGELYYELIDADYRYIKKSMEKKGKDPAKYMFDTNFVDLQKAHAVYPQKRAYPYDWVTNFVEGDGVSFEYGIDMIECGTYKLFKKLGAERYVPLQCLRKFREADIFGYGVFRTQTLAIGAPTCDYRYTKKQKALQNITEEEVTYYKEKKICLVCKGNIEGFNNYICPNCEVLYCEHCARAIIDLENACWACESPLDESKPTKSFKRKEDELPIKENSQKKE